MRNYLRKYWKCTPIKCTYIVAFILILLSLIYFMLKIIMMKEIITANICLIPAIETDGELLKYLNYALPFFECRNGVPPLVRQKDNCKLSRIIFKYLDTAQLDCSYSPIKADKSKNLYVTGGWKSFGNEAKIKEDYVKVNCSYNKKIVYEDFFAFPPKNVKKRGKKDPKRYNVLLLGVRSVSRINAYRKLPKFTNYLRYSLQAAEFSKYNAIGDTLKKNIVPFLTGMHARDFRRNCSRNDTKSCNVIWDKFAEEGYKILLAEDCVENGIFKRDWIFPKITADYTLMPFMQLYESNTGNIRNGECYLCDSSRKAYKVLLDYYMNFAKIMREKRQEHLAMLWINSLTNTDDPYDGLNTLQIASEDLAAYFSALNSRGFLENTFVIIFSDTGYLNKKLSAVRQIQLEVKQPLLFILAPKSLRKRKVSVANKLTENAKKLVSAFDVHKTLEAIAKLDTYTLKPLHVSDNRTGGLNLFETVPYRFCEDAGVEGHFCACKYIEEYRSSRPKKKFLGRF